MQNVVSRDTTFGNAEVVAKQMAGVYRWMTIGLSITGASAFLTSRNDALMNIIFTTPLMWVLLIGELGLVFYLSSQISKMSSEKARSMFMVYSALNGLTLASIFVVYTGASIASTFFTTAATFGAMSIYGYVTKKDLTSWGSFFVMGMIGVFLAMIVNMFLQSSALYFAINCMGVLVFIGLTAYDTQKIKNTFAYSSGYGDGGDVLGKVEVMGALTLYLDFINLFLFMLRLMSGRSND